MKQFGSGGAQFPDMEIGFLDQLLVYCPRVQVAFMCFGVTVGLHCCMQSLRQRKI